MVGWWVFDSCKIQMCSVLISSLPSRWARIEGHRGMQISVGELCVVARKTVNLPKSLDCMHHQNCRERALNEKSHVHFWWNLIKSFWKAFASGPLKFQWLRKLCSFRMQVLDNCYVIDMINGKNCQKTQPSTRVNRSTGIHTNKLSNISWTWLRKWSNSIGDLHLCRFPVIGRARRPL